MSTSIAVDVVKYLEGAGLVTYEDDAFANTMPDDPVDCVTVYEYGGTIADKGHGDKNDGDPTVAWEHGNIQVKVRNDNPAMAQQKCHALYKQLDGTDFTAADGTQYLDVECLQPPFLMQRDERDRVSFVFNAAVQRRQP